MMLKKVSTIFITLISLLIVFSVTCYADELNKPVEIQFGGDNPYFEFSMDKADSNGINNKDLYKGSNDDTIFIQGNVNRIISAIYNQDNKEYINIVKSVPNGQQFIDFCKTHFPDVAESMDDIQAQDIFMESSSTYNPKVGGIFVANLLFAENGKYDYEANPASFIFKKLPNEKYKLSEIQFKKMEANEVYKQVSAKVSAPSDTPKTESSIAANSENIQASSKGIGDQTKNQSAKGNSGKSVIIIIIAVLTGVIVFLGIRKVKYNNKPM